MLDNSNPVVTVSRVTEFNDLNDFMKDPDLDAVLDLVIRMIAKPDVPPVKAAALLVQLQALSFKFSMLSTTYSTIKKGPPGSPNNNRKNIYYTVSSSLDSLVAALKFLAKT